MADPTAKARAECPPPAAGHTRGGVHKDLGPKYACTLQIVAPPFPLREIIFGGHKNFLIVWPGKRNHRRGVVSFAAAGPI